MNYEILEHTGDAKIKVYGKTKEELFKNALLGMNAILKSQPKAGPPRAEKPRKVEIKSADINALLVDFLNEVNYLRQVHGEVYDEIKFREFSDTGFAGDLSGRAVDEFGEDIKAVTFHELDIKQNKAGLWETVVIFDL